MAQLFSQEGAKACFFFICPQTVMTNFSGNYHVSPLMGDGLVTPVK